MPDAISITLRYVKEIEETENPHEVLRKIIFRSERYKKSYKAALGFGAALLFLGFITGSVLLVFGALLFGGGIWLFLFHRALEKAKQEVWDYVHQVDHLREIFEKQSAIADAERERRQG